MQTEYFRGTILFLKHQNDNVDLIINAQTETKKAADVVNAFFTPVGQNFLDTYSSIEWIKTNKPNEISFDALF